METITRGSKKKAPGFVPMNKLVADEKQIADRQDICRKCEELFKATWTCKQCGCFMKIKTRLVASTCPKNKW
jgi:hypothetical protein